MRKSNRIAIVLFLLLLLGLCGCKSEQDSSEAAMEMDLFCDKEQILLSLKIDGDMQESMLSLSEIDSLLRDIDFQDLRSLHICFSGTTLHDQQSVLSLLDVVERSDTAIGIQGAEILPPSLVATDLHLVECTLAESADNYPSVEMLSLTRCSGMTFHSLTDSFPDLCSIQLTDNFPSDLAELENSTVNNIILNISRPENFEGDDQYLLDESQDIAAVLPLIPYTQQELETYCIEKGIKVTIRLLGW